MYNTLKDLVKRGVSEKRLTTIGIGSNQPIVDNKTFEVKLKIAELNLGLLK
jgi:outer membrane protein OmpA-like peptidoglycan-associated protein